MVSHTNDQSATHHEQEHLTSNVFDTPKTLTPTPSYQSMKDRETTDPSRLAAPARTYSFTRAEEATHDLEKGGIRTHLTPIETSASHLTATSQTSPLYSPSRDYSIDGRAPKECSMWPSRATLKDQAKADKVRRRGANCCGLSQRWVGLSRKQRLWIKVLIALLVIAVAVAIGIGISRAVGGGVWASDNQHTTIPKGNS